MSLDFVEASIRRREEEKERKKELEDMEKLKNKSDFLGDAGRTLFFFSFLFLS